MTSVLDQGNLDYNGQKDHKCKEEVVEETSEHVVFLVSEFSGVDFIEDLAEDEGVEDHCVVEGLLSGNHGSVCLRYVERCQTNFGRVVSVTKDLFASKEHGQKKSGLIKGLSHDVSPHNWGDNEFSSLVGFSSQQVFSRWFSCKCECSESIHDKVNPEHLD